jgi:arylsulfatase A-like enzyme
MFKLKNILLLITVLLFSQYGPGKSNEKEVETRSPNIVIIYLDDLGYGDVSAYGATVLHTPNMDRLAKGGVRFTNGYASSATCTPSRYALLTGMYPWRNSDAKILPGTAPLLIGTEELTLPKMLKGRGYHTGVVGKWHLGLGDGQVDWNQRVSPGPNDAGPNEGGVTRRVGLPGGVKRAI